MKTKLIVFASLLAAGAALGAEGLDVKQLPPRVRAALEKSAPGSTVEKATVRTIDGRAVYDIELRKNNAPNPHLQIKEDGEVLREPATTGVPMIYPEYGTPVPSTPTRLQVPELPPAVRRTLDREAAGRDIASIERTSVNGQPAYRVSFRESGRNPELLVTDDGRTLGPTEKPPGLSTLFAGTRFEDTPSPVQRTLRRLAGDGEIVKIDRDREGSRPASYRVELKDAHGAYQVRVSETGEVLENSRPTERPATRG